VLLMDEATVGLDPGSRQQLLATVRKLVDESQVAVLWATHLMEEIEVADRLLFLQAGTLRFDGGSDAFKTQFAGEPVMGKA
jgi:ABC-2 type transport system ATP-binding protein